MLEDILKQYGAEEVDALTVYSDMFRLGSGMIQQENEPPGQYKANPLGYYRNTGETKGHYRILFEDTFAERLKELQEATDFCIVNGLSYFGRKNVQDHASKMYAMIFDIDGVTDNGLYNLLNGGFNTQFDIYPLPNYVILSGTGIHLYFLFENPIPLFPYIKIQLKALKYALTERLWNHYTSTEKKPQFQGINQGFRVIGGRTARGGEGVRVRAFHVSDTKQTLSNLGRFVPENRVDESKLFKESKMSMDEARQKWPEWYQAVIVEKQQRYWDVKRDLYDWWKRRILEGATYHHRYFAIMCLAIYAAKCNISEDELKKDAFGFVPYLNSINENEPFTAADVKSALECYDKKYCKFPRSDMEKISGIQIKPNKRNGRKQAVHLKVARAVRDVLHENWREGNGRPIGSGTKAQLVHEWRAAHPDGKKIDCERDLHLSRHTVLKWWNYEESE